jgi:hypothetical protein
MFKKAKREMTDEITNGEEHKALAQDIGRVDPEMEKNLVEVDPFENIPSFTPGKPGFETGVTFAGTYVNTKRVYSEKFLAGKKDVDGRKYRDLHILRDSKNRNFGLWSVGQLAYMFSKLEAGNYVQVTYDGLANEAIKAGQSPSHEFTFKTVENCETAADRA